MVNFVSPIYNGKTQTGRRRNIALGFPSSPAFHGAMVTDLISQDCVVLAWRKGGPQYVVINPVTPHPLARQKVKKEALDSVVLVD